MQIPGLNAEEAWRKHARLQADKEWDDGVEVQAYVPCGWGGLQS